MITVRIDKELAAQLQKLAKRTGRPKSELIREALRRQLALCVVTPREFWEQLRR